MQNDLISRSALIEILTKYKFGAISNDTERGYIKETVLRFVDEQPTAYSVEKVDQQILEYFKEQIDKKPDGWDIVDFSCDVRNIVRNGRKE